VVVCDSIVAPNLGTHTYPIVISDDPAPLGSASNPIVIHVDENRCRDEIDQLGSDADTEIMATPEFWDAWAHESLTVPAVEGEAIVSSPIHAASRSSVSENPEDFRQFGQSSVNRSHLDDKALEMAGDDLAPMSSASNPMEIYVNKGWCLGIDEGYHADMETNVTRDCQEAWHHTAPTAPVGKGKAVGSSPIRAPSRSPVCEGPEVLQPCKQSPTNSSYSDDKAPEVTESSFDLLENCSSLEVSGSRNVADSQAGKLVRRLFAAIILTFLLEREQSISKGNASQAEEPCEVHRLPQESSMTSDAITQETTDRTDTSVGESLPCGLNAVGSAKRKSPHDEDVSSGLRRSERLTKRTRT
jgi:hypothetical protein